jgi:biopolymer transport protein ExbD
MLGSMKLHVIAALALGACGSKDEAPRPVSGSPSPAAAATARPPDGACVVAVMIAGDKVRYRGGGLDGEVALDNDLAAIEPRAGTCTASVWAQGDVTYLFVIRVLDRLLGAGIQDLGIGPPDATHPMRVVMYEHEPPPATPLETTTTTARTPDGKVEITGTFNRRATAADHLAHLPVVAMGRTKVQVAGKPIGDPVDADLDRAVENALSNRDPKVRSVVLHADAATPFAAISRVLDGAKRAGYAEVLFATAAK